MSNAILRVLTSRSAVPSLKTHPLATLNLMNSLAENGYLERGLANVQGGRWRSVLLLSLRARLEELATSPAANMEETASMLRLLPSFVDAASDFAPGLKQLHERLSNRADDTSSARQDWLAAGPHNTAFCLAAVLRTARELGLLSPDNRDAFVSSQSLETHLAEYHWHRSFLEEIAEAMDAMHTTSFA